MGVTTVVELSTILVEILVTLDMMLSNNNSGSSDGNRDDDLYYNEDIEEQMIKENTENEASIKRRERGVGKERVLMCI